MPNEREDRVSEVSWVLKGSGDRAPLRGSEPWWVRGVRLQCECWSLQKPVAPNQHLVGKGRSGYDTRQTVTTD